MKTTFRVLCCISALCALVNAAGAAANESPILAACAVMWGISAVLYGLSGR